jgi:hypothetical protein
MACRGSAVRVRLAPFRNHSPNSSVWEFDQSFTTDQFLERNIQAGCKSGSGSGGGIAFALLPLPCFSSGA